MAKRKPRQRHAPHSTGTTAATLTTFPATVVIDTAEQLPYDFADIPADADEGGGIIAVRTIRSSIDTGDYSLVGHHVDGVTVERKSKADLYRTISGERERFERELERMQAFRVAFVVVEAEISELLASPPEWTDRHGVVHTSKYHPKALHRTIMAWEQRYPRTHWRFCPGRRFAEVLTLRILDRYWQELEASEQAITNEKTTL